MKNEVWLADLGQPMGHEQGFTRPVLVVSVDPFNSTGLGLVVVLPFTTQRKSFPTHVQVDPPEGGLKLRSWAKCEDVRSISSQRLIKRLGRVTPKTTAAVAAILRRILAL